MHCISLKSDTVSFTPITALCQLLIRVSGEPIVCLSPALSSLALFYFFQVLHAQQERGRSTSLVSVTMAWMWRGGVDMVAQGTRGVVLLLPFQSSVWLS